MTQYLPGSHGQLVLRQVALARPALAYTPAESRNVFTEIIHCRALGKPILRRFGRAGPWCCWEPPVAQIVDAAPLYAWRQGVPERLPRRARAAGNSPG